MKKSNWIISVIVSIQLAGFVGSPFIGKANSAPISEEPHRILYQLYVRAFFDGSVLPDGEGDFEGLIQKLDYLENLGIDTILLMPVFESTGGMGYIPKDYFKTDPAYGSKSDLRRLIEAMHEREFKIMLDAPINHISDQSKWFKNAAKKECQGTDTSSGPMANPYCDFFYFTSNPCNTQPYMNWHKPWWWDQTTCNDVWFPIGNFDREIHRDEKLYATFFQVMPDLKFWDFRTHQWNQPVVDRISDSLEMWASLGVDSFRIDAAKHFVEGYENNSNPAEPRNMELLKYLLTKVRQVNPNVSFAGEIWGDHATIERYLPDVNDMVFDFPFLYAIRDSMNSNYGEPLKSVLKHYQNRQNEIKPGSRIVLSGNHDVSRMMTYWNDNTAKIRMAHFLTIIQPSIPALFYGEELNLHGKVKRPDPNDPNDHEEYVHTVYAFPWHGEDSSVGFPGGREPVVGLPDNYRSQNLKSAKLDYDSTYHLVKNLLEIRKTFHMTNQTKILVDDRLYGHVLGYSIVKPVEGHRSKCLTTTANFSESSTYEIEVKHVGADCGSGIPRIVFLENAEVVSAEGSLIKVAMGPYGKVIISNE